MNNIEELIEQLKKHNWTVPDVKIPNIVCIDDTVHLISLTEYSEFPSILDIGKKYELVKTLKVPIPKMKTLENTILVIDFSSSNPNMCIGVYGAYIIRIIMSIYNKFSVNKLKQITLAYYTADMIMYTVDIIMVKLTTKQYGDLYFVHHARYVSIDDDCKETLLKTKECYDGIYNIILI